MLSAPVAVFFFARQPHRSRIRWPALIAAVVGAAPIVMAIVSALRCLYAVPSSNPSEKASLLAAGIAELMNCAAFGVVYLLAVVAAMTIGRASRGR